MVSLSYLIGKPSSHLLNCRGTSVSINRHDDFRDTKAVSGGAAGQPLFDPYVEEWTVKGGSSQRLGDCSRAALPSSLGEAGAQCSVAANESKLAPAQTVRRLIENLASVW